MMNKENSEASQKEWREKRSPTSNSNDDFRYRSFESERHFPVDRHGANTFPFSFLPKERDYTTPVEESERSAEERYFSRDRQWKIPPSYYDDLAIGTRKSTLTNEGARGEGGADNGQSTRKISVVNTGGVPMGYRPSSHSDLIPRPVARTVASPNPGPTLSTGPNPSPPLDPWFAVRPRPHLLGGSGEQRPKLPQLQRFAEISAPKDSKPPIREANFAEISRNIPPSTRPHAHENLAETIHVDLTNERPFPQGATKERNANPEFQNLAKQPRRISISDQAPAMLRNQIFSHAPQQGAFKPSSVNTADFEEFLAGKKRARDVTKDEITPSKRPNPPQLHPPHAEQDARREEEEVHQQRSFFHNAAGNIQIGEIERARKESDEEEGGSVSPVELDQGEGEKYGSKARDLVHKVSEKNRRDRLSFWFAKLQVLLFNNNLMERDPTKHRRKGRNGEIRREDVLEMCETIIRRSSEKVATLNSALSKMTAMGVIEPSHFQFYTQSEIETTFDSILSDLCSKNLGCDRPFRIYKRQLAALNVFVGRSQGPHNKLFILAANCISHTHIDLRPKEALDAACLGWNAYVTIQQRVYKNFPVAKGRPIPFQGFDIGALFLGYKAVLLAAFGKYRQATRAWAEFTNFVKENDNEANTLTNLLPKTLEFLFRAWQGEASTRADYISYMREAEAKPPNQFSPKLTCNIKCGLGYVVSTTFPTADYPASPEDGVDICEKFVADAMIFGGEFADLPLCNFVVRSYLAVGMLDEGLRRANEFLAKIDSFGARGAGYCDLLKCKADCLTQMGLNMEALVTYESAFTEAKLLGHVVYEAEAALAIARLCVTTYSPQPIVAVQDCAVRLEALMDRIPKEERGGPITRELQKGLKSLKNLESSVEYRGEKSESYSKS